MMGPMDMRIGDWIETFTGRHFWPLDPRIEDIDVQDIAHALSNICRFTGHTKQFYSVAHHSLLCAEYAQRLGHGPDVQLRALLHDGSEAYLCDIARPVKRSIIGYESIEAAVQELIFMKFGLPAKDAEADAKVKQIDDTMLHMEARILMSKAEWATLPGDPFMEQKIKIIQYNNQQKTMFLCRMKSMQYEIDPEQEVEALAYLDDVNGLDPDVKPWWQEG